MCKATQSINFIFIQSFVEIEARWINSNSRSVSAFYELNVLLLADGELEQTGDDVLSFLF